MVLDRAAFDYDLDVMTRMVWPCHAGPVDVALDYVGSRFQLLQLQEEEALLVLWTEGASDPTSRLYRETDWEHDEPVVGHPPCCETAECLESAALCVVETLGTVMER